MILSSLSESQFVLLVKQFVNFILSSVVCVIHCRCWIKRMKTDLGEIFLFYSYAVIMGIYLLNEVYNS